MRRIVAALLLLSALAACKSTGPAQSTYTYHSIFSQQPAPASTAPLVPRPTTSADMAPGPWPARPGCTLNLYPEHSGIFQPDALTVQPRWDVRCTVKVVVFLLTMRLERWNGHAWDDELPIYTSIIPPVPYVPDVSPEELTTTCYPGKWRIEIHWSGGDALGGTFGEDRKGDEKTLSCM